MCEFLHNTVVPGWLIAVEFLDGRSIAATFNGTFPLSLIARAAGPGECGQYMYWKDGKCMDARNPTPEAWTDKMAKKKATW